MDSLVCSLVIGVGIVPAVLVMTWIKQNGAETWRISNFFAGLVLVGIAAYLTGLLTDWASIFDLLKSRGQLSSDEYEKAKGNTAFWLAIVPVAIAGIGINVITSWLQSKRPSLKE